LMLSEPGRRWLPWDLGCVRREVRGAACRKQRQSVKYNGYQGAAQDPGGDRPPATSEHAYHMHVIEFTVLDGDSTTIQAPVWVAMLMLPSKSL
jgi:hypothetical protein